MVTSVALSGLCFTPVMHIFAWINRTVRSFRVGKPALCAVVTLRVVPPTLSLAASGWAQKTRSVPTCQRVAPLSTLWCRLAPNSVKQPLTSRLITDRLKVTDGFIWKVLLSRLFYGLSSWLDPSRMVTFLPLPRLLRTHLSRCSPYVRVWQIVDKCVASTPLSWRSFAVRCVVQRVVPRCLPTASITTPNISRRPSCL